MHVLRPIPTNPSRHVMGPGKRRNRHVDFPNRTEPISSRCHTLGPGFRVQRASPQDDAKACLYRIHIWDTWKFFGAIIPPEWGFQVIEAARDSPSCAFPNPRGSVTKSLGPENLYA